MTSYFDLKDFFLDRPYRLALAADAEPFVNKRKGGEITTQFAAGGVSVALEPVARAANAYFVARGRTEEDKEVLDENGTITLNHRDPYTLKRIFLSQEEIDEYYFGFSNQTLWPLCHIAFEAPVFETKWFDAYKRVNQLFAKSLMDHTWEGEKVCYFVNDYQLSLVPKYLKKTQESILAFFWHIPWPTWEIFRILPQKKEILESLLNCDFLAFHRGYYVQNFFNTVRRELPARIDEEKSTIYYNGYSTTVKSLPMGIDTDVIQGLAEPEDGDILAGFIRNMFGVEKETMPHEDIFKNTRVILGVDRLDYTKGLTARMESIKRFYEKYPQFQGKVTYLGFLALSRAQIPSYKTLKKTIEKKAAEINRQFSTDSWKPIHLLPGVFSRKELVALYKHAALCLVTPFDDGMNLVSKEYVIAASTASDPGVLILSQFAGSATDLSKAIIINPHDTEKVADAMYEALAMQDEDKKSRMYEMAKTLEEHNVYSWVRQFLQDAESAARENRNIQM